MKSFLAPAPLLIRRQRKHCLLILLFLTNEKLVIEVSPWQAWKNILRRYAFYFQSARQPHRQFRGMRSPSRVGTEKDA